MKLIISDNVGFCCGLSKSLKTVENLIQKENKLCILGQLIHNSDVLKNLFSHGVREIFKLEEYKPGEILILRAHGSKKELYEELAQKNFVPIHQNKNADKKFFDVTCPFVKKIHDIVKNNCQERITIIVGDRNHSEIKGIQSYCNGIYYTVENKSELKKLIEEKLKNEKLYVIFQTTFFEDEMLSIKEYLKKSRIDVKIFDTVCHETKLRQREAKRIAEICDLVLVIGSKNSSNTNRLFEICKKIKNSILIETTNEIGNINFKKYKVVGLIAGASTPISMLNKIKALLSK